MLTKHWTRCLADIIFYIEIIISFRVVKLADADFQETSYFFLYLHIYLYHITLLNINRGFSY